MNVDCIHRDDPRYPKALHRYMKEHAPAKIFAHGDLNILQKQTNPLIAILCSAKVPPGTLLSIHDIAHQWRDKGQAVISGFHSLAEQEVLEVLLGGDSPVIICPARGICKMRIKANWIEPIEKGRLLILSPFDDTISRPTRQTAHQRNRFVAALADEIFIAHSEPGSMTAILQDEIQGWGKSLQTLENIS